MLHTIDSEHPMGAGSTLQTSAVKAGDHGKICVPGASSLHISFDNRTQTGTDELILYQDEDMQTDLKSFR